MVKLGVKVEVLELHRGIIDARVTDLRGQCSRVIGVYASTEQLTRRELWRHIASKLGNDQEPCVIAGDFNDILFNEEKSGGRDKEGWEMQDFRNFIDDNDLIDVGYVGYPFTWNNKRGGRDNIRMRLDRAVVNPRWRVDFPNGALLHLKPGGSDHCPILLRYGLTIERKIPRFIFDSRWSDKDECNSIVKTCWEERFVGSRWFRIQQKIRLCRKKLRRWRASRNLNSKAKMNELQDQLEQENEKTDFNAEAYKMIEGGMRMANREEEEYWRAKSRVSWLKLGDRNTSFFHAKTVQRRAMNKIHGLEDKNGIWREQDFEVAEIVADYFQNIFSSSNPSLVEEVIAGVQEKITDDMNRRLLRPVSMTEQGEINRSIKGVSICRNGPSVSHLFFADDTLLFGEASSQGITHIKQILEMYGKASGQLINYGKSCCFFSSNTSIAARDSLSQLLGIRRDSSLGNYLGLPTDLSQTRYKVFSFMKDGLQRKTEGWNEVFLNLAGKEVMLKSVALALPSYAMSCVKLPAKLCNELNAMMAKFWWGSKGQEKKIHWLSWDKLSNKKHDGGMGFKDLRCYNLAMLAKQGWRLMNGGDSLLHRVLKANSPITQWRIQNISFTTHNGGVEAFIRNSKLGATNFGALRMEIVFVAAEALDGDQTKLSSLHMNQMRSVLATIEALFDCRLSFVSDWIKNLTPWVWSMFDVVAPESIDLSFDSNGITLIPAVEHRVQPARGRSVSK
ncbi:hypothetical protein RHSIM_Rhsim13G0210000 [Rhododendron simsii]|uniref:Endonuclease/exonuclease/phosphatase domain-containing protein n=1 Tax=Rhododendron simsii TaxID=118357 RepID=A0A834L7Q7_RHOSS|nr:hypothetical protein RHSIM_Rhsim13G0210000 [Rhododendron simsii]